MSISKTVLTMLRHFDQDERESDRDIGRQQNQCCWGLNEMESKISVTKCGYKRSLKAAQRQEWSTEKKTKMEFYVTCERFKGILEVFQSTQNRWVMFFTPRNWKRYIFHRGLSWNIQSTLGEGLILGGKEEDKARHAVFLTPTNPSGDDSEEERPHDDFTVKKNALHVTKWKYDKNAVHTGYDCQRRRIKDWNSGRRSHLQSWLTLQYLEIVLIVWHLKMENELFSKGLKLQGRYLR